MSDWKEKRNSKKLSVSASKIETFRLCNRKWWLQNVRRLEVPQTTSQTFGNVVHDVAERFLKADDLGRDEFGQPVNLYPDGWETPRSRFDGAERGRVTPHEGAQIKRLVNAAIEGGILERRKDRHVEREFDEPIARVGDITVYIKGFIDVWYPDTIEDHKTAKKRTYFKSKDKLRQNPQMLIYAMMGILMLSKEGRPIPPFITLRHNQYSKDPKDPVVRKTEVPVSIEEIQSHWGRVLQDVGVMVNLRQNVENWHQIADPPTGDQACNAYGGCPFRGICSGRESVEGYENRLANHSTPQYNANTSYIPLTAGLPSVTVSGTSLERVRKMGFAESLAAARAKMGGQGQVMQQPPVQQQAQAPQPQTFQPPVQQQAPAPQPQTFQPPQTGPQVNPAPMGPVNQQGPAPVDFQQDPDCSLPPWVDPNDLTPVNGGCGFNDKGQPDQVSAMRSTQKGLPHPNQFDFQNNGDGTVSWVGKDGTPAQGRYGKTRYMLGTKVQVQQSVQQAPTQQPAASPTPAPQPVQQSAPQQAPQAAAPQSGTGGFILVINAVPVGQTSPAVDLHTALKQLQDQMSEQIKAPFHSLNAFDRRDAIGKSAAFVAQQIGDKIAYATGVGLGESDLKELVNSLKPLAKVVIQATI